MQLFSFLLLFSNLLLQLFVGLLDHNTGVETATIGWFDVLPSLSLFVFCVYFLKIVISHILLL